MGPSTLYPIAMAKLFQNLVVLMEPSKEGYRNSLKGGNMFLNRFCIDENAAFELSGVLYLEKSSDEIINGVDEERISKGKGYLSRLQSAFSG